MAAKTTLSEVIGPRTLEEYLNVWLVLAEDEWDNDEGPCGAWWAVANTEGVIAYFADENDARRFRLDAINREMYP